jgi:predicted alpha/beta hydrolase family esterase
MIINPYLVQPSNAYGTLTTAWIAATGETDLTILGALNTLETDLTTYGLTSKMKALYPMVGGTAGKHKFNFMDARDLDAAFRLVFNGGWTHSVNGALPNGTNAYADTKLNTSTVLSISSAHISHYARTTPNGGVLMANDSLDCILQLSGGQLYGSLATASFSSTTQANVTGFYMVNRPNGTNQKLIRNSTILLNDSKTSTSFSNKNIFLGAYNGGPAFPSNAEIAIASIGDGFTDTEAANFYTAVQTFQTTLGRSIGTQTVSDSDAQAFVTAASITDQVQANAVNNFVIGLKADGLWTKMKAIYPMVGGTAASHKFNLKNPLDTDAAYRLVFNGGWTHSSTGALPNGSNAYADTKLRAFTALSASSSHVSSYVRTTPNSNVFVGHDSLDLFMEIDAGVMYGSLATASFSSTTQANVTGFYMVNRPNGTNQKLIRNSTILLNDSKASSNFANTQDIILAAYNPSNQFSNAEIAIASIGDGLTDTEAANFYTRVQTYQTALSRNV